MAWRDQLRKGSFRGAPFFWRSADGEFGRKSARHDYPQRDDAWIEDLGKAPREFNLEVYVLGPDYMAARDKLIDALEEPGPGTLVHPTMGSMRVCLDGRARMSETTDEGGMARFSLRFVIAADNKYPAASTDTASAVATRADGAKTAAAADFAAKFSVVGRPGWISDFAADAVGSAIDAIDAIRGYVKPPLSGDKVMAVITGAAAITASVATLIRTPSSLASSVQGLFSSVTGLSDDPFAIFDGYRRLFDFGSDMKPVPRTTSNRIIQADNQDALVAFVRQMAVIEASASISTAAWDETRGNYNDAIAIRDELADRLDTLTLTASDDTYNTLMDLRAAVVADINARGANLSRTASYSPQVTRPALAIAYALYGDASRADEIITRNRIRHPAFISGGVPLEVVIDG